MVRIFLSFAVKLLQKKFQYQFRKYFWFQSVVGINRECHHDRMSGIKEKWQGTFFESSFFAILQKNSCTVDNSKLPSFVVNSARLYTGYLLCVKDFKHPIMIVSSKKKVYFCAFLAISHILKRQGISPKFSRRIWNRQEISFLKFCGNPVVFESQHSHPKTSYRDIPWGRGPGKTR